MRQPCNILKGQTSARRVGAEVLNLDVTLYKMELTLSGAVGGAMIDSEWLTAGVKVLHNCSDTLDIFGMSGH